MHRLLALGGRSVGPGGTAHAGPGLRCRILGRLCGKASPPEGQNGAEGAPPRSDAGAAVARERLGSAGAPPVLPRTAGFREGGGCQRLVRCPWAIGPGSLRGIGGEPAPEASPARRPCRPGWRRTMARGFIGIFSGCQARTDKALDATRPQPPYGQSHESILSFVHA
jgi:hypothetical protein